ncbi:MAG: hypothetical protein NWP83_03070, partial [Spirosomaceae bacterium]|nr:hypothetical protein [Spirosomataceae bacterium]
MKRRTFIKTSSISALSLGAFGLSGLENKHYQNYANLRVSEKRLVDRIAELAKFGIDEKRRGYR